MPGLAEWFVFLGTAALFAVSPGPGMLYVLARSLRGGRGEGVRSVLGNGIGACLHVVAAALGLSALLATSVVAFTVVKFAGAAYLVGLGLYLMFQRRHGEPPVDAGGRTRRLATSPLLQGILSEVLNPKTALYFMALLPHFVHPERAPAALVFVLLGLIAVAMALVADLVIALFAGGIGARLRRNPRWWSRQRLASGATMIGLGGFVAVAEQGT
ncbi:LysE family translocator [Amycolatopsis cihanbeyliensis]|uniref:Threonine/homoserine/homoserine lactone efflux protein n=1 Tax=Amycolatopsis cihanbeyliensis TaxID=1128664 RepID=A0A542DDD1_AMYCI|nr:LysE family translocator [Amycolatopsis cihanbeyliensis]TQJ01084.1 threonine/homoserine/homoserine lactone efflux protein [Amycolatopsis cihanbeyliensis]